MVGLDTSWRYIRVDLTMTMNPINLSSDESLWQSCVDDDQRAFDLLFTRYFQGLCQYAGKYNLSSSMVEEVVADVFVNLWLKRKELKIQHIRPYLFQSTRNTALNFIKKSYQPHFPIEDLSEEISDKQWDADLEISYSETEKELNKLVDQLPDQQRDVFRMRRIHGYSLEEISDILNISSKTVSNHLTQASKFINSHIRDISYLLIMLVNI